MVGDTDCGYQKKKVIRSNQDLGFNTLVPDLSNSESESTADQSKAEIKEETSITEGESEARKMQTLDDDESITCLLYTSRCV